MLSVLSFFICVSSLKNVIDLLLRDPGTHLNWEINHTTQLLKTCPFGYKNKLHASGMPTCCFISPLNCADQQQLLAAATQGATRVNITTGAPPA